MSSPQQFGPPRSPADEGRRTTLVLVVVGVVLLALFLGCCGVLCAGAALFYTRAEILPGGQSLAIKRALAPPPSVADWMAERSLAPVYTMALDAVAGNQAVRDSLGEPIETVLPDDPDAPLYRRQATGELSTAEETIEFSVQGPRGAAVVRAVATPTEQYQYRLTKITVAPEGGAEIVVPPPEDQPALHIR